MSYFSRSKQEDRFWFLGSNPQLITPARFEQVSDLIDTLICCPAILDENWMLIGQQVDLGRGNRADLVAIDERGTPRLVEVTNRTPSRESLVALLARAEWLASLSSDDTRAMYRRFAGDDLEQAFRARFECEFPGVEGPGELVLVTADNDSRTQQAAAYLRSRGVGIIIITYTLFASELGDNLLRCERFS